MRHHHVTIKRDTQTSQTKGVPAWEVPVLEFIFEDGNVERLETSELVPDQTYPEAAAEFNRLERAYGVDSQSGVPHVASVYGQAGIGIRALRKAIDEAKAEDAKLDVKDAKPFRRVSREVDSLLA